MVGLEVEDVEDPSSLERRPADDTPDEVPIDVHVMEDDVEEELIEKPVEDAVEIRSASMDDESNFVTMFPGDDASDLLPL